MAISSRLARSWEVFAPIAYDLRVLEFLSANHLDSYPLKRDLRMAISTFIELMVFII
jgi:hypothetical protein